jgi:hypothetical protein
MKAHSKKTTKKWGTGHLKCSHPDIRKKDGITYCSVCGKNFHSNDPIDNEYYGMFYSESQ